MMLKPVITLIRKSQSTHWFWMNVH